MITGLADAVKPPDHRRMKAAGAQPSPEEGESFPDRARSNPDLMPLRPTEGLPYSIVSKISAASWTILGQIVL